MEKDRQVGLPCAGSFPQWLPKLQLSKAEAKSHSFWISQVSTGAHAAWLCSVAFLSTLAENKLTGVPIHYFSRRHHLSFLFYSPTMFNPNSLTYSTR